MNEVTAYGILKVLREKNCGLSAKAIAKEANIDTTSENLRNIEEQCWDFVEMGNVTFYDLREETNGALFFQLV